MMDKQKFSIHRLNVSKDIGRMAELIDLCFGQQMDPDGIRYLNYLRNLAKEKHPNIALISDSDKSSTSIDGFICKVDDRLIGNLNISLYQDGKKQILFISNIAVHPEFRNQGIAGGLINHAIDYALKLHIPSVWLQVRIENEVANHLYSAIGFQEMGVRDTWVIQPTSISKDEKLDEMLIVRRKSEDWIKQEEWLVKMYPVEMQWQLEIDPSTFKPQLWQKIVNLISGRYYLHWSFFHLHQLIGVITWQSSFRFADQLWMAAAAGFEDRIIESAFPFIQKQLMKKKPLMINLTEGIGNSTMSKVGFEKLHTLKWMKKEISNN